MRLPQQGEPSVDEILESIKKVMARDNDDAAMKFRPRPTPSPPQTPVTPVFRTGEPEILDLAGMDLSEDEAGFVDDGDDGPLIGGAARDSIRDNLAALAMFSEPGGQPPMGRSSETSLEGIVREMLRPMIAEWLDKNLPGMVEKMVQAEFARIAGKQR